MAVEEPPHKIFFPSSGGRWRSLIEFLLLETDSRRLVRSTKPMYEVDFLPVESENGQGGKSGDAIAIRLTESASGAENVIIIDGGYSAIGENLVQHVEKYYGTSTVDLAISTHPDADHLNGLSTVVESLNVRELMVHQPRLHMSNVSDFSNIESLDNLLHTAKAQGTRISEPFSGDVRFNGHLVILGPTETYYTELLAEHLLEAKTGTRRAPLVASAGLQKARSLLERALSHFPFETLSDDVETGPRNNSSVITLIQAEGQRLLFTGDAGIPALEAAADRYEEFFDSFVNASLDFFQAPHHGSRRNVGPTILDRILGPKGLPYGDVVSFISSAKNSEKHPSPKVVNALGRRGCSVFATEGKTIHHGVNAPLRPGWVTLPVFPPLTEDDDD